MEDMEPPTTTENGEETQRSESKDYLCDRCGKTFTTKKYLRSHLKTIHESPRLFICPLCGKQLAREKGLNQHVRTIHEGNWSVFCSLCGKGFINHCRLKKHCTNVHERSNRFVCPICVKGFTSDAYRMHHMELVHCRDKEYACVACEENFATKNALLAHVADVHGDREAKAKSELTDEEESISDTDVIDDLKPPISPDIQPTSSDDQPLDLSMRKYRPDSPESVIPNPCFQTPNTEPFQNSFAEVSSTSRGPGAGPSYTKVFDSDNSNQSNDSKGNRHSCTYCEKSFASKEYQRLHEATVHEGTKAFICSACGKHFSVHQALRKHYIIQHEGGKPYRCRDCKMEFRTRATLRSHRSTVHTKPMLWNHSAGSDPDVVATDEIPPAAT